MNQIQATATHNALVTTANGGLEVMELQRRPTLAPGPGQVQVRLRAAAFNHLDLWVRRGEPAGHWPTPIIPCADGAGVIAAVGEGVSLEVGTPVAIYPVISCGHCDRCRAGDPQLCRKFGLLGENVDGCAQEVINVGAADVAPLPEGLTTSVAAAMPTTFITAWHMLQSRARLQPGERVVVHAPASGVGSAAIQLARVLGAEVVATVRREADEALALSLGATVVLRNDDPQWSRAVRKMGGADVVFEHVGAATWGGSVKSLRRGGRLVTCGATAGHEVSLNLRKLFFHSISLLGSTMGTRDDLQTVLTLAARGLCAPHVGVRMPLAEGREAMAALERREVQGKVVLEL